MLAAVFIIQAVLMLLFKIVVGLDGISWEVYSGLTVFAGVITTVSSYLSARKAVEKLTLDTNPHAVALIMKAVNHIVGNLMNQFQFVRQQIADEEKLSTESADLIDSAMEEAQAGLQLMNGIGDLGDDDSYAAIYPK